MKAVHVLGHSFDCLPGHVNIPVRGVGSNLRIAVCDAVRAMFADKRLRRKRLNEFKLSVVIVADAKIVAKLKTATESEL